MKRKIELLAPGGDIDAIKAAIVAGADAIYCGLNKFNARNRATNLNFDDLNGVINLAHGHHCKIFLTLNIIIVESEIPSLITLLNKLMNTRIDGVIVQDLGLLYLLSEYFKGLKIHASTQLTTHNEGQILFLNRLNTTQVNLSRELNINEIEALTSIGHKNKMLTEVFVHGSYCISFSGICYMSSVLGGKSGNRGRCSQPCRDKYITTPEGKNFPLNLKDNSAYFDLKEISDAGVDSLKIEGRIKKLDYVYTVVNAWKKQIRRFYKTNRLNDDNSDLYKVFNRDFSNSYLKGDIHKQMFIDNPRDNSIQHLSDIRNYATKDQMVEDQIELYDEKEKITSHVKNQIKQLSIAKRPITISISGKIHKPLKVIVKTPIHSFTVLSEIHLVNARTYASNRHNENQKDDPEAIAPVGKDSAENNKKYTAQCLDYNIIFKRLKSLNNSEYFIKDLELENLQNDLFIPFKELSAIKKRISFILNGSKGIIDPIDVPRFKKQGRLNTKPNLAVLISSQEDLHICNGTSSQIFFEIPNCFENEYPQFITLFSKNKTLIPWFPSILMGESYAASVAFLQQVQPKMIATNNTGIAYEACKNKIPWIAGPYLNTVNSFALLCLKEKFNCYGAFISNEISKNQIKSLKHPDNFKLYYSIYHPILLLSSRQCLLHQVIGCEKESVNEECISKCLKSSSIKNLKKVSLHIEKTKGNYHCIYNNHNFLNPNIVTDIPDKFSYFFIDLRDIKTETKIHSDKFRIIRLFENLLNGNPNSKKELKRMIHPTTSTQYEKGI